MLQREASNAVGHLVQPNNIRKSMNRSGKFSLLIPRSRLWISFGVGALQNCYRLSLATWSVSGRTMVHTYIYQGATRASTITRAHQNTTRSGRSLSARTPRRRATGFPSVLSVRSKRGCLAGEMRMREGRTEKNRPGYGGGGVHGVAVSILPTSESAVPSPWA